MNQVEGGAGPSGGDTNRLAPERTGQIEIARSAEEVFAFVADVRNLPAFLSGMRTAAPLDTERVAVEGAQGGRRYRAEGWMRVDREALSMEWSTLPGSERSCAGTLRVVPIGGADATGPAAARSRLELRLRLGQRPTASAGAAAAGMRAQGRGQAGRTVEEAIAQTLASIRSLCEGTEAGRGANPRGLARIADAKMAPGSRPDDLRPDESRQAEPDRAPEEGNPEDSRPYGRSGTMNPPDVT
ncbi:MAG: SRPBCC family protein [Acetobacteraceae bacterium]|nr:SRPBCC family protein [Acetobacteraceae bacterium]